MTKLKRISKRRWLPQGGLKLHYINRILWDEFEDFEEDSGEDSEEYSDEDSGEDSEEDSEEDSDEDYGEDSEEDSEEDFEEDSEEDLYENTTTPLTGNWRLHTYEKLYIGVDPKQPWDYGGRDPKVFGYGGERYRLGKESTKNLYMWYKKYGFIENPQLNTYYKCFDETPLPAMELNLKGISYNDIYKIFIERKYVINI